jgi:hypothetical protein
VGQSAVKRAAVQQVIPHAARASSAGMRTSTGTASRMKEDMEILGDVDLQKENLGTTQQYMHLSPGTIEVAIRLFSGDPSEISETLRKRSVRPVGKSSS